MATNVVMPRLGESVVEGVVSRWLAAVGDRVAKFTPVVEISTDKVDTEIPSPTDGVLLQIVAPAGTTVAVGSIIAVIGEAGEMLPTGPERAVVAPPPPVELTPALAATPVRAPDLGFISPVVARLAAEHGLDLGQITGTGMRGRIRKQDVLAFLAAQSTPPPAPPALPPPSSLALAGGDEIVPLNHMRRLIAEHMVHSKHTAPHVTTVFDCDLTAVVRHRYAQQEAFARAGADLTFTPYFAAAIVAALKQHPYANASWTEDGILLRRAINLGVAVAIATGLVVPVIANADSYNLLGLARAVNDLAHRARAGQLRPDEVQGGTFTLTNHGVGGSLFATPIIHQPQTGILGVGRIHKEPVVISPSHSLLPNADDAIAIRPIAYLSFTFDHRVLDGATADAFVQTVRETLMQWS